MAAAGGGMAVLPQYQGDFYSLQRQQALAQALMQSSMTPQNTQAVGSGPYQIVPKYSVGGGLAQLGQALLASRLNDQVAHGYQQLGANQAQAFGFGGGQQQQQPDASQAALAQGAAQGSVGPTNANAALMSQQQSASPAPQSSVSPMNPIGLPPALAWSAYNADPAKYAEIQAAAFKPADIVSQIRAAGVDPNSALGRQIAQQALAKANYVAPTSIRGQFYSDENGIHALPAPAPEGFQQVPDGRGGFQIVPQQGGPEAVSANATAKAGGKAQYELHEVWDPTANNGQGGYVQQTVANVAGAAGAPQPGSAPLPLRNNNPGAVSPGGSVARYPDMQTGIAAMDQNLASYAKDPKVRTLGDVITKWVGSPPNAPAYIKDVSTRLGIPPSQPVDLTNPAQRLALSSAIMLHESGPGAVFAGGGVAAPASQQRGPMASQPPLGTAQAANSSQGAPSKQMGDTYSMLADSDNTYQQSREALQEMLSLAGNKGAVGTAVGVLPESVSTKVSPDAAKYQKLHATYVALQGKALGASGTNEARATINESVPTYDKPQSAMVSGLQTQLNNLDMAHLKTQFLTPIYQKGDEKGFTQQSAAFDQNIKPTMLPVLQLSGPQQRAAVQAAIKANPSLRSNFEWAFDNGMLK